MKEKTMGKFEKLSLQEMIDTREHTIKEMRSLNDGCTGEDGTVREFTGDEEVKYRAMGGDVKDLTALISKCKRENELKGFTSDLPLPQPQQENRGDRRMEEFREFLRDGKVEKRDTLVIDGSGASAAVLAPEELVKQILMPARSDLTLLGKVYTVHLNKAASLGVPYESADASDASWTTEVPASLTADATLAYNKRELGANMLIKLITVSDKTLQTNAFNVESLIADKLSYKMRAALEKAVCVGTGTGQPLGLFVANSSGIPASADFTAANTNKLTGDDIIKAKRAVKSIYRSRGSWLFHSDVVTDLLLLKDKNDQYLWRSGLTENDPDILDGSPVIESEWAPHTMTTGLYCGMFGDFSKYWMTMVDSIAIRRLDEKYYPSVGFSAKTYADGQPVMPEAFARIKLA